MSDDPKTPPPEKPPESEYPPSGKRVSSAPKFYKENALPPEEIAAAFHAMLQQTLLPPPDEELERLFRLAFPTEERLQEATAQLLQGHDKHIRSLQDTDPRQLLHHAIPADLMIEVLHEDDREFIRQLLERDGIAQLPPSMESMRVIWEALNRELINAAETSQSTDGPEKSLEALNYAEKICLIISRNFSGKDTYDYVSRLDGALSDIPPEVLERDAALLAKNENAEMRRSMPAYELAFSSLASTPLDSGEKEFVQKSVEKMKEAFPKSLHRTIDDLAERCKECDTFGQIITALQATQLPPINVSRKDKQDFVAALATLAEELADPLLAKSAYDLYREKTGPFTLAGQQKDPDKGPRR